jgi:hypothetical protein
MQDYAYNDYTHSYDLKNQQTIRRNAKPKTQSFESIVATRE